MRIQSYREAHSENDIFNRSRCTKSTMEKKLAGIPVIQHGLHIYMRTVDTQTAGVRPTEDALELQAGHMVYARCEFDPSTGAVSRY